MTNTANISASIITDGADISKLERAVQSVLSSCFEVVICANGNYEQVKFTFRNESKIKVFEQVWEKDFSKARNEAIEKCKGDWILIIDSDERLKSEIKYLGNDYDIYFCQMTANIDFHLAFHYEMRLFKNGKGIKYAGKIHERLEGDNLTYAHCNLEIEQYQITVQEFLYKARRNEKILELDESNPYKDYYLCQLHYEIGDSYKAIESGEKVLKSDIYTNQTKSLVAYWIAQASQRFYQTNDVCKQMLLVSLAYEPLQIVARSKMIEILEQEKANPELLLEQYKTIQEINSKKLSKLPMEVYFPETFFQNKIDELQWQQQ